MNRLRGTRLLCAVSVLSATAVCLAWRQEPAPPISAPPALESTTKTVKSGQKKYSHSEDFLIRGTVFNERALSFPGVELHFRREGQKKYKWETATNSRGEFAVRVPQGSTYEILVHVKGFADQTRTIDAKGGGGEETVVFRMEPITGGKK